MNKKIEDFFGELGLDELESKIYLFLLSQGAKPINVIAEKLNVKRASTYPYIKSLLEKGYIAEGRDGKKSFYVAEDPEKIIFHINEKEQHLDLLESNLPNAIDELNNITELTKAEKTDITFYKGLEGVKKIYLDTLKTKTPILAWFPAKNVENKLGDFLTNYIAQRVKKGIWAKGILLDDHVSAYFIKKSPEQLRDPVFLPMDLYDFTNEINIYDDKVAIMSVHKTISGVIIKNQEFADSMRAIHSACWDYAKNHTELMNSN